MKEQTIGPLSCLQRLPRGAAEKNIVILHGYGANAYDLYDLADHLDATGRFHWYFPQAPLVLGPSPWPESLSRAWWHIDPAAVERAMASGTHRDLSQSTPEGTLEASRLVQDFLAALGFAPERAILGGFSQGAMLATELALSFPVDSAGLIILSGNLLDRRRWQSQAESRHFPFFQSHGSDDPLLSPQLARELFDILNHKGSGEFWNFSGGHTIPPLILEKLRLWLAQF